MFDDMKAPQRPKPKPKENCKVKVKKTRTGKEIEVSGKCSPAEIEIAKQNIGYQEE